VSTHGTHSSGGIQIDPFTGTTRDRLIAALTVAMTDEQARDAVDALDACLDEGPGRTVLVPENLRPHYGDIAKLRQERDTAIEVVKQALQKMKETIESLERPSNGVITP
jgi:hypothetical protein